jgi:hypothetical protein
VVHEAQHLFEAPDQQIVLAAVALIERRPPYRRAVEQLLYRDRVEALGAPEQNGAVCSLSASREPHEN